MDELNSNRYCNNPLIYAIFLPAYLETQYDLTVFFLNLTLKAKQDHWL